MVLVAEGEGSGVGASDSGGRCCTFAGDHGAGREEEQVDQELAALDLAADVVDVPEQREVGADEEVPPGRVERPQLEQDARRGSFRAADKVDARLDGVLGKLLHGGLPDAAGAADEDGDEARGEALRDPRIGGAHLLESNHLGWGCPRLRFKVGVKGGMGWRIKVWRV